MPTVPHALLFFAPERWGEIDRYIKLHASNSGLNAFQQRILSGVGNHMEKADILFGLAERLRPNFEIDRQQMDEHGFTPAANGREVSAVIEAGVLELYSSVDCAAKVLFHLYGSRCRGFKDSTRKLFETIDTITGPLPDGIRSAVSGAQWFRPLRILRDELTHRNTGSCTLDHETLAVRYFHAGIPNGDKPLIIDDIYAWMKDMFSAVNTFLGSVFHDLNANAPAGKVQLMCGMTEGRMLMRHVDTGEPVTFDSGICLSRHWFDQPENPACPFKDHCGAYERPASPDLRREVYGSAD